MWERGNLLFVIMILFVMIFSAGIIYAEEIDVSTIDENAVLEETEGITPDSIFYPIDKFFDNFADDVKVRQEAVAEIRAMIEEEKYEDAFEALEKYKKHADKLEREVSPEQRDETRRSAAAIYNVLKSLEAQIPDEHKEDFFDDIIEREERILTAAEIASKIKELCEELSELDPVAYERTCRTSDEDPRWHRDLDDRLTEEQRQEAEAFFEIMLQCFETSGGTCRCEDISIKPFADKCSQIAPLAYACDVEDNEEACDEMDAIEEKEPIEDLLPDYLREVLRDIENKFEDERFEHYGGPRECDGINDKSECEERIFRLHAPPVCVEELFDNRGLEFNRDYGIGEAKRDCEEIMFDLEAPQECLDEGLTDFRECGRLIFQLYAPQECIDAGLTGEHRGDERRCREIAGDFGRGPELGPGAAVHCGRIENPDDRLACYDAALSGEHFEHEGDFREDYEGRFEDRSYELQRQCSERCYKEGKAWDFSNGVCECFGGDYRDYSDETPYDCTLLDCLEGYYCDPYEGCVQHDSFVEQPTFPDIVPPECDEGEYIECIENVCKCVTEDTATEKLPPEEPITTEPTPIEPAPEEPTVTGSVISNNAFIKYYFG